MHPRLYRLIETQQRIDGALREERNRRTPDAVTLTRLTALKLRARALAKRFARQAALG
jgi:hypothetical protein